MIKLGVMAHSCNTRTREVKEGRFQVLGHPEIHIKTLSQNKQKPKPNKK
jgi:hypothetical protein